MPSASGTAPLITAGNFSLDDTLNPGGEASAAPGGDALYSAIGAAMWRYPVSVMSRIGEDYPADLVERVAGLGIGTETLQALPGPSVHYRITNAASGERIYEHLTPELRLHELSPQGADLDEIRGARWVHVAAMPLDLQEGVIARCRAEQVPYSLDPHEEYIVGYEPRLRDLVCGSVFMPSELEIELLFPDLRGGQPPEAMAQAAAGRLLEMGAHVVAIKLGARGCLVTGDGDRVALRSLPIPVLDTTGAGDAFCGGFLAGYLQTDSLSPAAVCGTLSAAHIIRGFGAFHSEFPSPATLLAQATSVLCDAPQAGATRVLLQDRFPWLDGPGRPVIDPEETWATPYTQ